MSSPQPSSNGQPTGAPAVAIRNPDSLRRVWWQSRFEAARAKALTEEIQRWDGYIAEAKEKLAKIEAALEQLRGERNDKDRQLRIADDQAHDFEALVKATCELNGWALPEEPAELPLTTTGQFPAVPQAAERASQDPAAYAELVGRHIAVRLTDGVTEVWGDLVGADEALHLRDLRGNLDHVYGTAIGQVITSGGRTWTPDRKDENGATIITVKRCCNECGTAIGDATEEELHAPLTGKPLADVRGECPTCTSAEVSGTPVATPAQDGKAAES